MTLSRLCKPLACLLAARRCVAAVEFALLVPVFVLVFAGIVDLGNALWTWCRLEEAVAAGTDFALVNVGVNASNVNSTNGQDLASYIAGIVANSAKVGSYLTPADVTVVVVNNGVPANADLFWCPTRLPGSPPSWSWGSSYGSAGTACTGGWTSGKFVTVSMMGPTGPTNSAGATFAEGSSGTSLSGVFYLPYGPGTMSDAASIGNGIGQCLELIGSNVNLTGGSAFASTCSGLGGSSGTTIALVQ